MKYEILTSDDDVFLKHLLVHLFGVVELFHRKAISGQDVWDSIRLFYPKVKIEGYHISKQVNLILGLISEIEWSRDTFPETYPASIKQLRSLLKKEICRMNDISQFDQQGNFKWSVTVTTVE